MDTDVDLEKPTSIVGWCPSEVDGVYEVQGLVKNVVKLHDDGCAETINHAEPPPTTVYSVAVASVIYRAQLVVGECVFEIAIHGKLEGISDLRCSLSIDIRVLRACIVRLIKLGKNSD